MNEDEQYYYQTTNQEDGTTYNVHPSAFGAKNLEVTLPETKITAPRKYQYRTAFDPTAAWHPAHAILELMGKGFNRVTDATGTTQTLSKAMPWIMPSQYVGWIRTGNRPGTEGNTGFGTSQQDQYLNEMFDLGVSPALMKGIGKVTSPVTTPVKAAAAQATAQTVSKIPYRVEMVRAPWAGSLQTGGLPSYVPRVVKKKPNSISIKSLQPQAQELLTPEAGVKYPYLIRKLNENQTMGDFVTRVARGDESVELPLFNDNGVQPTIGTVAEVVNAAKPEGTRFVTTWKGIQPIEGEYRTTKSFGNYDYSSNNLWNATQYADVGRNFEGSLRLLDNGFDSASPQYKYIMDRYRLINSLQNKYKTKWGTKTRNLENVNWNDPDALLKAINPRTNRVNNHGTNQLSMSYEQFGDVSLADAQAYQQAMREISQFWGSGKEALHAGGVRQQALLLPNQMERVRVRLPKPTSYEDLKLGTLYKSTIDKGSALQITPIKGQYNMNALAKSFEKQGYPYFSVENVLDPELGTTYGSRLERIIWGHKKGGKIKVSAK